MVGRVLEVNYSLKELKVLLATTKESSRTLSELIRTASKASAQSSSTLVGVVGGLIGTAGAYGLTFAAPVSLAVLGPVFTGLGIVVAILLSRGRSRLEFEKKLEENRIAADEIMSRIKALPRNTPQDVRDELWATYKTLNSMAAIASKVQQTLPPPSAPVEVLDPPSRAKQQVYAQTTRTVA